VSVVVCTHNGERFIKQQLDSILNQTRPPDEIVVSDDASADGTIRAVTELFAESGLDSSRYSLIRNTVALGVARNFQQAILASSGEVIILADQDDIWHKSRIESALDAFAIRSDLGLLHGDAELIDAGGKPTGEGLFSVLGVGDAERNAIHSGNGFSLLLKRNLVTGATVAFRRSLVGAAFPVPPSWLHDEWLAIIAAALGQLDVTERKLIEYRQHDDNVIGVRALTPWGKLRRVVESRGDRGRNLVTRARDLVAGLSGLGDRIDALVLAQSREKLAHQEIRSSLSRHRIARLVPVLREALRGNYSKFGRGIQEVLRDLLQPF
jgi:glycosyltransferase involved in cell wall biosynthesis